jgi:hypothetical protein
MSEIDDLAAEFVDAYFRFEPGRPHELPRRFG